MDRSRSFAYRAKPALSILLCSVVLAGCSSVAIVGSEISDPVPGQDDLAKPRGYLYTGLAPGEPGTATSLNELVFESDVVLIGELVESKVGRTVGPEDEPGVTFLQSEIAVIEVLRSSENEGFQAPQLGSSVYIETDFLADGRDEIGQPGDRMLLFLWLKRDPESAGRFFRPLLPDAVFIIGPDNTLTIAVELSPLMGEGSVTDQLNGKEIDFVKDLLSQ